MNLKGKKKNICVPSILLEYHLSRYAIDLTFLEQNFKGLKQNSLHQLRLILPKEDKS